MKKIVTALLVSAALSAPAFAASGNNNVEVNYGLDWSGVVGIQGDFDISSAVNAPISVEAVYKNYSQSYNWFGGGYKWSYTGIGVAGIYDLSSVIKVDPKVRPYVGAGIMHLSATFTGPAGATNFTSPTSGGVYVTGGVKYMVTPQFAADLNYNNFGGLTVGAALYF
jgi:opacity protein-like surface antigen